jgi:hypothetical protein
MKLTPEHRTHIDGKTYEQLLRGWRFSSQDAPWMQGETGDYWAKRMKELKELPGGEEEHVRASKAVGWREGNDFS